MFTILLRFTWWKGARADVRGNEEYDNVRETGLVAIKSFVKRSEKYCREKFEAAEMIDYDWEQSFYLFINQLGVRPTQPNILNPALTLCNSIRKCHKCFPFLVGVFSNKFSTLRCLTTVRVREILCPFVSVRSCQAWYDKKNPWK